MLSKKMRRDNVKKRFKDNMIKKIVEDTMVLYDTNSGAYYGVRGALKQYFMELACKVLKAFEGKTRPVEFTGGEALLHPDFGELVECANCRERIAVLPCLAFV